MTEEIERAPIMDGEKELGVVMCVYFSFLFLI